MKIYFGVVGCVMYYNLLCDTVCVWFLSYILFFLWGGTLHFYICENFKNVFVHLSDLFLETHVHIYIYIYIYI